MIALDHVAVRSRDRARSAKWLADLLGRRVGVPFGPWVPVPVSSELTLLFHDGEPFAFGHYAFRVDQPTFDAVLAAARRAGAPLGSAPGPEKDGRVSEEAGESRVYVRDPDGNSYEFMTAGAPSHA